MPFKTVNLSSFRVAFFVFFYLFDWRFIVFSSFRLAFFLFFFFSRGVISSFLLACCLFFFSRGVISRRKDEMVQTSHHTNQTISSCIRKLQKTGNMMNGIQWNEYIMNLYKFLIGQSSWTPRWISQLVIIYSNLCRQFHILQTMMNIL